MKYLFVILSLLLICGTAYGTAKTPLVWGDGGETAAIFQELPSTDSLSVAISTTSGTATFEDTVTIAGDLTVNGDVTDLNSALDVSDTATFSDTINVAGIAELDGGITVDSTNFTVDGASGAIQTTSTINAGGKITATNYNKDGNVWTVGDTACDATTVQGGIDLASSGDVVFINAGTYSETIIVADGISLVGIDRDQVIIGEITNLANTNDTIIQLGDNCGLYNLTVSCTKTSGGATNLIGIGIEADVTGSCTITNVLARIGGALGAVPNLNVLYSWSVGADIYITDCDFYDTNSVFSDVLINSNSIKSGGTSNKWHIRDSYISTNKDAYVAGVNDTMTMMNCEIVSTGGAIRLTTQASARIHGTDILVKLEDLDLTSTYDIKAIVGGATAKTELYISNSNCRFDISNEDAADLGATRLFEADEARVWINNCNIEMYGTSGQIATAVFMKPGTAGYGDVHVSNTRVYLDGVGTQYNFYHDDPNAGDPDGDFYIANCVYDKGNIHWESPEDHYDTRYWFVGSTDVYDTARIGSSDYPDTYATLYMEADNNAIVLDTQADTRGFKLKLGDSLIFEHGLLDDYLCDTHIGKSLTGIFNYFDQPSYAYYKIDPNAATAGHLRVQEENLDIIFNGYQGRHLIFQSYRQTGELQFKTHTTAGTGGDISFQPQGTELIHLTADNTDTMIELFDGVRFSNSSAAPGWVAAGYDSGTTYYDSDVNKLLFWSGTAWETITSAE